MDQNGTKISSTVWLMKGRGLVILIEKPRQKTLRSVFKEYAIGHQRSCLTSRKLNNFNQFQFNSDNRFQMNSDDLDVVFRNR